MLLQQLLLLLLQPLRSYYYIFGAFINSVNSLSLHNISNRHEQNID
jgi:hypothetical protein